MFISAIALSFALAVQQKGSGDTCDTDCVAILNAATEWALGTLERAPNFDRRRTYIDIASASSARSALESPARGPEGLGGRVAALAQIARRVGLNAWDSASDAGWRACTENRSEGCRAARGMTIINIPTVTIVSGDEAIVYVTLSTLNGRTQAEGHWSSLYGAQLYVGRVDGEWKVVREGLTVVN
jgi:hypothetical protein